MVSVAINICGICSQLSGSRSRNRGEILGIRTAGIEKPSNEMNCNGPSETDRSSCRNFSRVRQQVPPKYWWPSELDEDKI